MSEYDSKLAAQPSVYRTFEDGYKVRAMTVEDAKIVQKWYAGMGIISPHDLDIALQIFPPGPGFFIGEYENEVVASAIRISWGDNLYFGSYYYVEKAYRAKGFGTRLRDQVARGYVGDNMLCIDAVLTVVEKNAAKFGYVGSFTTRRYCGKHVKASYGAVYDGTLVKADGIPFQDLIGFDNKHFVIKDSALRRKYLAKWLTIPGGSTIVCLDISGGIVGYGSRRPAVDYQPNNHFVGPLYAEGPEVARVILQRLCQEVAGDSITFDMWTPNAECLKMMDDFGFQKEFDVLRMHVNGNPDEYKDTVYAVTSIDTCSF